MRPDSTESTLVGYNQLNKRTKVVERMVHPKEIREELELRQDELRQQYESASKLLPKVKEWIDAGHFGNVTGYTVGLRKKNGRTISPLRYVIEIHVEYKRCKTTLGEFKFRKGRKYRGKVPCLIPEEIEGVMIKVVETRPYRVDCTVPSPIVATSNTELDSIENNVDLRDTVLIGGVSVVERGSDNWGTMGIVVRDENDSLLGICNAHFAAEGSEMVQPAAEPGTTTDWGIGSVTASEQRDVGEYHVDAAAISINSVREAFSNLLFGFDLADEFLFATTPLKNFGDGRNDAGKPVYRIDLRLNQRTRGNIDDAAFKELKIGDEFVGTVIKARRSGSGSFIRCGDSGSALATEIVEDGNVKNLIVGLCFAGSEGEQEILFACNFSHVIQALELEIPDDFLRDNWTYA